MPKPASTVMRSTSATKNARLIVDNPTGPETVAVAPEPVLAAIGAAAEPPKYAERPIEPRPADPWGAARFDADGGGGGGGTVLLPDVPLYGFE
ncbi:MAG: hypothetical protein QM723_05840 [Myxococcaceae bacterium]